MQVENLLKIIVKHFEEAEKVARIFITYFVNSSLKQ